MKPIGPILCLGLLLSLSAPGFCQSEPSPTPPLVESAEVPATPLHANFAEKATNAISLLGRIKLQEIYSPTYQGGKSGRENTYEFQGLLPIPWPDSTESGQLIRLTVPFTRPVGGNATYLGDIQIFDLMTVNFDWGLIGAGPMAVFPSAASTSAGKGQWQLGPALGLQITAIPRWQIGFLAQNPISIAGDASRSPINELWFQPMVTYHLDDGWYLNSDAQLTFNWVNGARQYPVNLGVGRVFEIGDQPVNLNLLYERMLHSQNTAAPTDTIKLRFTFLLP